MADLWARAVEAALVMAMKARARANGNSVEDRHRAILDDILTIPGRRCFAEVLAAMPDVGTDSDFERA